MKQKIFSLQTIKHVLLVSSFSAAAFFLILGSTPTYAQSLDPVQSGSVGLTGTISAPPPAQGAVITVPSNGQSFSELPIPVRGLCPDGTLVKIFKNNVFSGSVQCVNGSFEIQIDLFTGTNEIVARVYDDLDQPGPDSNKVTVEFVDSRQGSGTRVSVTSNFAKRGANPDEKLTWPIIISGGSGPYAISVDWGDGTTADLLSQAFPGVVDLAHIFKSAGIYNVVVKVSDSSGAASFLQLVAVVNGPLSQTNSDGSPINGSGATADDKVSFLPTSDNTQIVWWPAAITVPFIVVNFWFGKRYMLRVMKKRIERGEHPFADI